MRLVFANDNTGHWEVRESGMTLAAFDSESWAKEFAAAPAMLAVLYRLAAELPELDGDEELSGADAVDVLCSCWPDLKAAIGETQSAAVLTDDGTQPRTITIEVEGGCVQDVYGLPDSWKYAVDDLDEDSDDEED